MSLNQQDGSVLIGKVGQDLSIAEGQQAARSAMCAVLAALKGEIENLERVETFVSITGLVNCPTDFIRHSEVIEAASVLLVDAFGERGRHSRIAYGAGSLPIGAAIEIKATVLCEGETI